MTGFEAYGIRDKEAVEKCRRFIEGRAAGVILLGVSADAPAPPSSPAEQANWLAHATALASHMARKRRSHTTDDVCAHGVVPGVDYVGLALELMADHTRPLVIVAATADATSRIGDALAFCGRSSVDHRAPQWPGNMYASPPPVVAPKKLVARYHRLRVADEPRDPEARRAAAAAYELESDEELRVRKARYCQGNGRLSINCIRRDDNPYVDAPYSDDEEEFASGRSTSLRSQKLYAEQDAAAMRVKRDRAAYKRSERTRTYPLVPWPPRSNNIVEDDN